MGTLIQKTHSQPAYSVSTPPSSTPIAAPAPAIAPRMPRALLRSAPSSNVTSVIENTEGASRAEAPPWSRRATMSMVSDCETAQSSEKATKPTRPTMNTRRRPSTSPSRPPSSRKEPKVRA